MTVMNNFPVNSPSTSRPGPPGFSGGSYHSYQQFQQQHRAGAGGQQSWNEQPSWKPDPDAYTPQGAVNFAPTANWVNGPMYGSSAALPSYYGGSAAPSVVSNLSFNGTEFGDNQSVISTMSYFDAPGGNSGQFSSRASTCSAMGAEAPHDPEAMAKELITKMGAKDEETRCRAKEKFDKLMRAKVGKMPVLDRLDEPEMLRCFDVLLEDIANSIALMANGGEEERDKIRAKNYATFRILHYITTMMPRCNRVFCAYVKDTHGKALHTVFKAIPNFTAKPTTRAELNPFDVHLLTLIFQTIHSAFEERVSGTHCRNCLRHASVVERFMKVLAYVANCKSSPRIVRLKRAIILCLTHILNTSSASTPERLLELLRTAIDHRLIEILLESLEDDVVGLDMRAVSKHQTDLTKNLALILKVKSSSFGAGNDACKALVEDIYTRFLKNDGFRKISKLTLSHVSAINEAALTCLCRTGHRPELRTADLREPCAHLLHLIRELSKPQTQQQPDLRPKKCTVVLNRAMAALALIVPTVKEQLSAPGTPTMLLNVIEREQRAQNDDVIESALIILVHLLNAGNHAKTAVSAEIISSAHGARVLLDQLSFAEVANKKRAVEILNRLDNVASIEKTLSSDGTQSFSSALYYGIERYSSSGGSERCVPREQQEIHQFLRGAYNLLRTFCQDFEFASAFVRDYILKKNIILNFTTCTSEPLALAIVEFALVVGEREPRVFDALRNDPEFPRLLEEKAKLQNELGVKCQKLKNLERIVIVNSDIGTAMMGDIDSLQFY